MKLLAFDTSSSACSVGLSIHGKVTFRHEIAPMQQAKLILPMISELLQSEKMPITELDAIAFGCGPGSFTGVRIAVSIAQGLAFAAEKPLISISSLAAVAQAAYQESGWQKLVVAMDARIQEVYWASYEVQENQLVKLLGKEQVSRPEEMVLPENSFSGVGNAWEVYHDRILAQPLLINTQSVPTAAALLSLAEAKFQSGNVLTPREASPVYLRDDVAKKSVHIK